MASEPVSRPTVTDEQVRAFGLGWIITTEMREAVAAELLELRAAVAAPAPDRWQDLDPSLWQRMKDADPVIRAELMRAWHDRDAALAEVQMARFLHHEPAGVGGVPAEPQPPADASWLKTEDIGGLGIREMLRRRRERRAGAVPQDRKAGQ